MLRRRSPSPRRRPAQVERLDPKRSTSFSVKIADNPDQHRVRHAPFGPVRPRRRVRFRWLTRSREMGVVFCRSIADDPALCRSRHRHQHRAQRSSAAGCPGRPRTRRYRQARCRRMRTPARAPHPSAPSGSTTSRVRPATSALPGGRENQRARAYQGGQDGQATYLGVLSAPSLGNRSPGCPGGDIATGRSHVAVSSSATFIRDLLCMSSF